eukprot:737499-Hanusia_phi.AAC.1
MVSQSAPAEHFRRLKASNFKFAYSAIIAGTVRYAAAPFFWIGCWFEPRQSSWAAGDGSPASGVMRPRASPAAAAGCHDGSGLGW